MVCDILLGVPLNTFGALGKGGEIMFVLVIITLAGISLYFLLKPPANFQNELVLRYESISETELVVRGKQSMPTLSGFGKVY